MQRSEPHRFLELHGERTLIIEAEFYRDFADGHLMLGKLYREKLSDPGKALPYLKKAEKLFMKVEDYQRVGQIRQLLIRRPAKSDL